jgi:glycerol-3-phosphate dehydrogenase (NAD(P)+)
VRAAVIGGGSWGTALAIQLARAGNETRMWDHRGDRAAAHQEARENLQYLPGVPFPESLLVSDDLAHVLADARTVLAVVPAQVMREVMRQAVPHLHPEAVVCCASKGIEQGTLMTMAEVLSQVLPTGLRPNQCFLAGPSFAKEVAMGLPTAVVVASRNQEATDQVAQALHSGPLRVYHTDDIIGAEYGGALKNIVAIACGIVDGVGLGLNARAGLITRGLAEITRLAVHRGANPMTLAGLAGMGDLVLTCTGDLSRNRRVGLALGAGRSLDDILTELGQVAEGVTSTRSARNLSQQTGVSMPIVEQMYGVLYEDLPVKHAIAAIMGRERRAERG